MKTRHQTKWSPKSILRTALFVLILSVIVIADAVWVLVGDPAPLATKYAEFMQLIVASIASCFAGYFVGLHCPDLKDD